MTMYETTAKGKIFFAPETLDTPETEKAEDQENAPALQNVADDAAEPKDAPDGDIFDIIRAALDAHRARSAWGRGVKAYAAELLEELEELSLGGYFAADDISDKTKATAAMLNGAKDWRQYSWGGSALIYDGDIAERLCNPSELKKTRGGERRPNAQEDWLDVQARALGQAARLVCILAKEASR